MAQYDFSSILGPNNHVGATKGAAHPHSVRFFTLAAAASKLSSASACAYSESSRFTEGKSHSWPPQEFRPAPARRRIAPGRAAPILFFCCSLC
jgi:hypothetical protein